MQHYCAMKMTAGPNAGRWHYCVQTTGGGHPVGNCSPWDLCPECLAANRSVMYAADTDDCATCHGKRKVNKETPCPGHDTAEEACEHQRQFLLDIATYHQDTPEVRAQARQLHTCEAVLEGDPRDLYRGAPEYPKRNTVKRCGAFTCGYASHGPCSHTTLCPDHCNREFLAPLVIVGESWQS